MLLSIDKALRLRAKQEAKPVEHTDLDALIGSWQEDEAFDRAIADFEKAFI